MQLQRLPDEHVLSLAGRRRHAAPRVVLAWIAALLLACQPVEVEPLQAGLPRTLETNVLSSSGLQIDYPLNGVVDTLAPPEGATLALRIRGPDLVIGQPEAPGSWVGPAYAVDIIRFDNPRALSAQEWVSERVFGAYEPLVADTTHSRISGRAAVRVSTLDGDAHLISIYVRRDRQMAVLRYREYPGSANPAAPAAAAIHGMIVGSFRFLEH
jgi:hypothetical protein